MDLELLAARHRESAGPPGSASIKNVSPSLRDFGRYVTTNRQELAVIAELRRRDPDRGALGEVPDPAPFVKAAEEGGAYGICIAVHPDFGGSLQDVRAASAAAQVPVLARSIVLDESDLYRLREAGADAAVLYAALHPPERITALRKAARSMHMELLVEVTDDSSLANALASEAFVIAISGVDDRGKPALERAAARLAKIPEGRTPVLSTGIHTVEELAPLLPLIDAVLLLEPAMSTTADPAALTAAIEPFTTAV